MEKLADQMKRQSVQALELALNQVRAMRHLTNSQCERMLTEVHTMDKTIANLEAELKRFREP